MTTKVKKSSWDTKDNMGYVSLFDTGAKGDGTTDDTAAFNAALATGKPVYIPPATFVIGSVTIPDNTVVFGHGSGSILRMKVVNNAPLLSVGSGVELENFAIDGNKTNQVSTDCHGVLVTSAAKTTIAKLTIYNTKGDGINVTGTGNNFVQIQECAITGTTKNGITVEAGKVVSIDTCYCAYSDAVASPGDGFSISSNGSTLNTVSLTGCIATNNSGRGFVIAGNTSKNVTDCSMSDCHALSNVSHGFHMLTTERDQLTTCTAKSNGGDGFRLEGDVQHSRLAINNAHNNGSYGIREVVAGSTPNYNGFIYSITRNNGNDTVTKVGANSTVVSI